jgi:hypothetical protein
VRERDDARRRLRRVVTVMVTVCWLDLWSLYGVRAGCFLVQVREDRGGYQRLSG